METFPSDSKKKCFKCGRRKLRKYFYKHAQTADGLLGKCKACTKKNVHDHRSTHRTKLAAYEKRRATSPERRKAALVYQRARRVAHPRKYKARTAVSNALRDGTLKKQPCAVCGSRKVQAHHADYRKPLAVTWLCFRHHREGHGHVVSF